MVGRTIERGQLILVGAVAIAVVIVGFGLVVNTMIYTQSAAPQTAGSDVDQSKQFKLETANGLSDLYHRVNVGDRNRTRAELKDDLTTNTGQYERSLAESYARSEGAVVRVKYDEAESEYGTRVVQQADDRLVNDDIVRDASDERVGWFLMNVNVSQTSGSEDSDVSIDGDSGGSLDVSINRSINTVGTTAVWVNVSGTDADGNSLDAERLCAATRNRFLVELSSGRVFGEDIPGESHDCGPIPGIEENLEGPHTVTFSDGERYFGTYELITDGNNPTGSLLADCHVSNPPGRTACETPAVWNAVTVGTYNGSQSELRTKRSHPLYP